MSVLTGHPAAAVPQGIPHDMWAGFLADVLRRSGLLVEHGGDFDFWHRTLLEFLAAEHDTADAESREALYAELFGRFRRERPWSRRTWSPPDAEVSYVSFVVGLAARREPGLDSTLVRLAERGGLLGRPSSRARHGTASGCRRLWNEPWCTTAASALVEAGHDYRGFLVDVVENNEADSMTRGNAAAELYRFGDHGMAEVLVDIALDSCGSPTERRWAVERLAALGDPRSTELHVAFDTGEPVPSSEQTVWQILLGEETLAEVATFQRFAL